LSIDLPEWLWCLIGGYIAYTLIIIPLVFAKNEKLKRLVNH